MNVIISNERQLELGNLEIEVIKAITGEHEVDELISMFSNFFFGRLILDLTAIKGYKDIRNMQKLSMSLDVEKIIVLLPNSPECSAPQFLSRLISMGIYNFTSNIDGINYLLNNPNTYRDVAHLHQIEEGGGTGGNVGPVQTIPGETKVVTQYVTSGGYVLGIKNLTDNAGATTLTVMLKNHLQKNGRNVVAIEADKHDFAFFNDKDLISVNNSNLANEVLKYVSNGLVIIDLNKEADESACTEVLYLVEPSTIKLNKLMRKDRDTFTKLKGKKIILAKSLLTEKDIAEFEFEAKTKVFYNLPPLDDRLDNSNILADLVNRVGIGSY